MDKIVQSKTLTKHEKEIEKFLAEKIDTLTTSEYLFRQSDDIYDLTFKNLINLLDKKVKEFKKTLDFSLQLKDKYSNKDFSKDIKEIFESQIEFQRNNIENYNNVSKYLLNFIEDENKSKQEKRQNLIENKDYLIQNVRVMNRFHHLLKENNNGVIQSAINMSPNKTIMQFLADKKEELFGSNKVTKSQKLK